MLLEAFQSNLKRLRLKSGLTQGQLAQRSGRSLSYISELERHNREPSLTSIEAFADALGVPPLKMLAPHK